jgi:nucleotide-binding universal stress UspA family protein
MNSYKTLLVHVDRGKRCSARLDLSFTLARQFEAHVVGLHAISFRPIPSYALAESGAAVEKAYRVGLERNRDEAKALFEAAAKRAGDARTEWRSSDEDAVDAVSMHARYADLVVIGQAQPDSGSGVQPDFPAQLVLRSGRPILVVPYAGRFDRVGKRVLIAWDARREATRALTDALPLLQRAESVQVVSFNPKHRPSGVPGADIGLYLARHDVKVEVAYRLVRDLDIGNQLLSRTADHGADLIVMGAYGHSRLQEMVLGGVTRTILESMTVPVLMSH